MKYFVAYFFAITKILGISISPFLGMFLICHYGVYLIGPIVIRLFSEPKIFVFVMTYIEISSCILLLDWVYCPYWKKKPFSPHFLYLFPLFMGLLATFAF